ncbi:MAG: hypothetical protein H0Z35_09130 [Thermoanaerobacteraceae bacterium]|nr:hypothetical protein [Thermoanaerobacteraceae bacterium]
MEERVFQKVERMLYRYWGKKKQIERLQKSLATVEQHIKDIRVILSDKEELYPSLGVIGKYMVVVGGQGGGGHGDPVDDTYSEFTRTLEQLRRQLADLNRRRVKLKLRIFKLEQEIDGIEFAIGELEELEQKIVEQRYFYKRSNVQIGLALHCDEKTIRRKREEIIERIAGMLEAI